MACRVPRQVSAESIATLRVQAVGRWRAEWRKKTMVKDGKGDPVMHLRKAEAR